MPVKFTENRRVTFNDVHVGDGEKTFITFEAGPTHSGLDSAKALVTEAAKAGADAVKFQVFDPDRLVSDRKQLFSYDILLDKQTRETNTVEESLYDIFVRRALSKNEWRELKAYSDSLNLAFFATVGFSDELQLMQEIGCDSIKIASSDVNHFPFIREVAKTGMCVQLDTGNASLGEIEQAVDVIRSEGNERIIIHQCPSGYPARIPSINLRIIETLRQLFPYPVAYSDHTPDADMDIAAVSIGANLVEKTITFDRTTPSVEHIFSLEPHEMATFIQRIRDVEVALGATRRILTDKEVEKRNKLRRSVFITTDAVAGTELEKLSIDFRRPGDGISPDEWDKFKTFKLKHNLAANTKLNVSDFEHA